MPIAINGSGILTGISVGGLPDGIVDADMLAANAVTAGKLASGVGGKILQVVSANQNTRLAATSTTFQATANSVTITPSLSSSKILFHMTGDFNTDANGRVGFITVYRKIGTGSFVNIAPQGSNDSNSIDQNYGFLFINGQSSRIQVPCSISYLDSPNTTDATEYKIYIRSNDGGTVEFPTTNGYQSAVLTCYEVAV